MPKHRPIPRDGPLIPHPDCKSHIMALVADEGLALFCGLDAMPKKSFLSEYASRITPEKVSLLLTWHARFGVLPGKSLNPTFTWCPISASASSCSPLSARLSRRQPSIFVFLAHDADSQVFCYSTADIHKGEEAEQIFRFIEFWTQQYHSPPQHLVFDSKLTSYHELDRLDEARITFTTLRWRSPRSPGCSLQRGGGSRSTAAAANTAPRVSMAQFRSAGEPGWRYLTNLARSTGAITALSAYSSV